VAIIVALVVALLEFTAVQVVIRNEGCPTLRVAQGATMQGGCRRAYYGICIASPIAANSARRQQACQRFSALLDRMQEGNAQFSEEEVEADVLKAVEEVRRSKHKK